MPRRAATRGLEFVFDPKYEAKDYPKAESEITIAGVFELFENHGYDSFHLVRTQIM